jgi:hypothetical protein
MQEHARKKEKISIFHILLVYLVSSHSCSFILNPPLDPQSGCRRQCLGVGAKTVETLGLGPRPWAFQLFLGLCCFKKTCVCMGEKGNGGSDEKY